MQWHSQKLDKEVQPNKRKENHSDKDVQKTKKQKKTTGTSSGTVGNQQKPPTGTSSSTVGDQQKKTASKKQSQDLTTPTNKDQATAKLPGVPSELPQQASKTTKGVATETDQLPKPQEQTKVPTTSIYDKQNEEKYEQTFFRDNAEALEKLKKMKNILLEGTIDPAYIKCLSSILRDSEGKVFLLKGNNLLHPRVLAMLACNLPQEAKKLVAFYYGHSLNGLFKKIRSLPPLKPFDYNGQSFAEMNDNFEIYKKKLQNKTAIFIEMQQDKINNIRTLHASHAARPREISEGDFLQELQRRIKTGAIPPSTINYLLGDVTACPGSPVKSKTSLCQPTTPTKSPRKTRS